jgi:hypothetical protein
VLFSGSSINAPSLEIIPLPPRPNPASVANDYQVENELVDDCFEMPNANN